MKDNIPDSLLIIMVVFRRALADCEAFQSILKLVDDQEKLNLFVYDNSPSPQDVGSYKGMDIVYTHDPENSGVSKAYNTGAKYAKESNKEWILLLDQDTSLSATILDSYRSAISRNPNVKLLAPILLLQNGKIFSPCRYRFKRGFYLNDIQEGLHSLNNLSPVNSGMMVNLEAFEKAGGYNDNVKLDFSDFQFVERFRQFYQEFYVIDERCIQDFSNDEVSPTVQAKRFEFFCDGARNIEKKGLKDRLLYHLVVLVRSLRLSLRYRSLVFISILFNRYFRRSEPTS